MKTQVCIIGCGPAGLVLSQLLARQGITSIIVDRQSREHIEGRIRAGVLEWNSVEILREAGAAKRLDAQGIPHSGFELAFEGQRHRIDLEGLTGRQVMVYGQTEVTRDLMALRIDDGQAIYFSAEDVRLADVTNQNPAVEFIHKGETCRIECDFIAGCDGFHGVSRQSIPQNVLKVFEREYPFGWLGLLTERPPVADELIYANHSRGFALCSMRSQTRSRYYIQCPIDENVNAWSDARFWEELALRIGPQTAANLVTGPAIEKSIAPLRSFVAEPMQYGRLFLAGDAAHIVPPTGAKGLNMAIADVHALSRGFERFYKSNDDTLIKNYSETCLQRVWKVERFSWYLSQLMHQFPRHSAFEKKMQRAEFDYIRSSEAASKTIAENYVGLHNGDA